MNPLLPNYAQQLGLNEIFIQNQQAALQESLTIKQTFHLLCLVPTYGKSVAAEC